MELELTRSFEMDQIAFKNHLADIHEKYGKILWINLLDNRIERELVLT